MKKIKSFEFSFEIGGFYSRDNYKIFNQDRFIIIQNMEAPGLITDANKIEISDLEWDKFWNRIDLLGVCNWEKDYIDIPEINPHCENCAYIEKANTLAK